jgi:hypothetical protein
MPQIGSRHRRSEIRDRIKQFFGQVEELPSPDIPEGINPVRLSELIGKENVFIKSGDSVSQTAILDTMKAEGFDPTEVYAELVLMKRHGEIFEPRKGYYKFT